MREWITDHRPTEAGEYEVTLECEGGTYDVDPETGLPIYDRAHFTPDGTIHRWYDCRYYAFPNAWGGRWTMDGEDATKFHWTEEAGSLPYEHVVAWMPFGDDVEVYKGDLREGKKYVFADTSWISPPEVPRDGGAE